MPRKWLSRVETPLYCGSVLKSDPSTWTDARHRKGAAAESQAADLLRREGYAIIEQRFRYRRHDIDLVARRGNTVVFVEVKARSGDRFGSASQSVTSFKQMQLVRAASAWLQRHGTPGDVARFDVVAVQEGRLSWLQGAFRPGWR